MSRVGLWANVAAILLWQFPVSHSKGHEQLLGAGEGVRVGVAVRVGEAVLFAVAVSKAVAVGVTLLVAVGEGVSL